MRVTAIVTDAAIQIRAAHAPIGPGGAAQRGEARFIRATPEAHARVPIHAQRARRWRRSAIAQLAELRIDGGGRALPTLVGALSLGALIGAADDESTVAVAADDDNAAADEADDDVASTVGAADDDGNTIGAADELNNW